MGAFRLLLAVLVAAAHVGYDALGLHIGVMAVVSFFLLSGYVMTAMVERHYPTASSIPAFYLDRVARLQPQYLVYLLASGIMFASGLVVGDIFFYRLDLLTVLSNVAILPTNFYMFGPMEGRLMIAPGWSLGLEVGFYLLFPFLMIFGARRGAYVASLAVFVAAWAEVLPSEDWAYRFLPGTLFIFLIGSFLRTGTRSERAMVWATVVGCAVLATITLMGTHDVPWNKEVLLGVVLGTPILQALARGTITVPARWDERLGDLSYGVFLNHYLVIWFLRHLDLQLPTRVSFLVVVAVSLPAAWVTARFVERPVTQWRRRVRTAREGV